MKSIQKMVKTFGGLKYNHYICRQKEMAEYD